MSVADYRRVRCLGRGGFGAAYLVTRAGKQLVLKEIHIESKSRKEVEEARKEAKLLAAMSHPNIVNFPPRKVDPKKKVRAGCHPQRELIQQKFIYSPLARRRARSMFLLWRKLGKAAIAVEVDALGGAYHVFTASTCPKRAGVPGMTARRG